MAMVANRMPKIIGVGRWKRAASIKDRICVLSPISARPTTMVETRNASTGSANGVRRDMNLGTDPSAQPGHSEPMPKVPPDLPGRLRHDRSQVC